MKIAHATFVTSGLAAVILGMAAPAQAIAPDGDSHCAFDLLSEPKGDVDHLSWLDVISPKVTVPEVDTTAQLSR